MIARYLRVFEHGWSERSLLEILRALGDKEEIVTLAAPALRAVVAVGPRAARAVLLAPPDQLCSRLDKDPVVRLFRNGLLVVDGPLHDALRATIEPLLRGPRLTFLEDLVQEKVDQALDQWIARGRVDLLAEFRRLTLEILLDGLFGLSLDHEVLSEVEDGLCKAVRYISPGFWLLCPWIPRPGYQSALARLDDMAKDWIRSRRWRPDGEDLLTAWVRCPWMDDDLIRDQLLTMLIAGHDTVTAWLAWTTGLLLQHPAAWRRAQEEILRLIGHGPPALAALQRARYLDAVAREALRLFPPIPILNRRAAVDLEIEGLRVPRGTRVMVAIYVLHRRPDRWPDPTRFRPERFLENETGGPFAFLPFGGGPRFCVGASFAWAEGRLILARMLQRVRMRPLFERLSPRLGATLVPRGGVPVLIEPAR